jgi:hypothetical protein
LAGRDLYLTRFTLRHTGLRDTAADVDGLRRQFLDYLSQRSGFRNVTDATAGSIAVSIPQSSDAVTLEVDADLSVDDHLNFLLGFPVFWPFFGYWPLEPRHGKASVSASAYFFGPGHQLLSSANPSESAAYDYWLYGWSRTAPIQEAFRRAYEKVFNLISGPQGAGGAPAHAEPQPIVAALTSDADHPGKTGRAKSSDYALIVGIEAYRGAPKAESAEHDAAAFREYARETLGVPEQNIVFLTGSNAGRSDLAKYLEEWLPRNVAEESRVYFYYSGHGAPDPTNGTAYIMPWDADPAFLQSTAFPLSKVYDDLGALKAKESLVFMDSCFSGAGGRSLLAQGTRPLVNVKEAAPRSSKVSILTAAAGAEVAGTLPDQRHGLFTYYLLRGLQGEANRGGHLTLEDLFAYLRRSVVPAARRQNREQTPQLQSGHPQMRLY